MQDDGHNKPAVYIPIECSNMLPQANNPLKKPLATERQASCRIAVRFDISATTRQRAQWHSEIKSMRTSARHLRQGAAQAILSELLNIARQRGYERVSLETGSTPGFDAAMAEYRRFGFMECGPFAVYKEDPFSRFMPANFKSDEKQNLEQPKEMPTL